jgi:hypothetical protein
MVHAFLFEDKRMEAKPSGRMVCVRLCAAVNHQSFVLLALVFTSQFRDLSVRERQHF